MTLEIQQVLQDLPDSRWTFTYRLNHISEQGADCQTRRLCAQKKESAEVQSAQYHVIVRLYVSKCKSDPLTEPLGLST